MTIYILSDLVPQYGENKDYTSLRFNLQAMRDKGHRILFYDPHITSTKQALTDRLRRHSIPNDGLVQAIPSNAIVIGKKTMTWKMAVDELATG